MITIKKDPKDVPVSVFIALSMIVVFLLFNAKVVTAVPCGKSIHEVFMSNFVHIDTMHLMSNLYALYTISKVEQEMGFTPFIWLLIFLIVFNTIVEFIARRVWKNMACSIGFSGILFGLFTWELVSKKKFDVEMLIAIVIMVVGPSLKNKKVSLSGHAVGAVSGIIAGIIWKFINKQM
jgi:membrane associated rhomboid family serine protease